MRDEEARTGLSYQLVNRRGWDQLSRTDCDSSRVCTRQQLEAARECLDRNGWIPWGRISRILCLASGGGQQGPLFAALGYQVTVADISPQQLEKDRIAAGRYGLVVERVLCDAMDLAPLAGRQFDLVYQPVSSLYLPDVRRCYRQVAKLLPAGGLYWTEHWNPVQMQLDATRPWDGSAYRLAHPQRIGPVPAPAGSSLGNAVCWHYIHSLADLLGGLCQAGFVIRRFAERSDVRPNAASGTGAHLSAFVPAFLTMLAELSG